MKPKVVASECCAALHPQNTLRGFQFCLDSGVDGIEFDVHLSQDDHVVVQHDFLLNRRITRNPSGNWLQTKGPAVCDLTISQLKEFDVGRYASGSPEEKSYPNYLPFDGEQIPTLEELLHAHKLAGSDAELWIELKTTPFDRALSSEPSDLLTAVLKLVEEFGVVSKTILLAFEWQLLVEANRTLPGVGRDFLTINPVFIRQLYKRKGAIRPEDTYLPLDPSIYGNSIPETIAEAGGGWWGPYVGDVTAQDIKQSHDCGVPVNVWGVESNDQAIEEALLLNADAITLSDSALLQSKLLQRKLF